MFGIDQKFQRELKFELELENLFRKRKGNTLLLHCLISGLLAVSLLAQFPPLAQLPPSVGLFLPAAQLASSLAPRSAQRQPPAQHRCRPSTAASNRRRAFLAPVAAASRAHLSEPPPSPRGSATVRARRCSNRRPRLASWERPPRSSALLNSN